jgi:hypothetical protein
LADVLAWKAPANDVNGWQVVFVDFFDIFKPQCVGIMLGKHCPAIVVLLNLKGYPTGHTFKLKTRLQSKLKAPDACKQATDAKHYDCPILASFCLMTCRGSISPLMTA